MTRLMVGAAGSELVRNSSGEPLAPPERSFIASHACSSSSYVGLQCLRGRNYEPAVPQQASRRRERYRRVSRRAERQKLEVTRIRAKPAHGARPAHRTHSSTAPQPRPAYEEGEFD